MRITIQNPKLGTQVLEDVVEYDFEDGGLEYLCQSGKQGSVPLSHNSVMIEEDRT